MAAAFQAVFRIQRLARWIRKPCAFPRPRRRRRGNVFWRKGRCRRAFGTRKKGSPGGPAVNRSRLSGVAQRQRRHSCFRLDAFVVVKVDITVNHFIGLGEGCRFVAVDTLCFENREMNFLPSHCHTGFQGAALPGNVFCKRIDGVGLSNILDREGGENLSGSSPVKGTHRTGVAPTLVGS